ncbi:ROK family transcriptional regulator [Catellatospora tritici]|uniref:ROK family transcriptional regulator n=1 Tax=Catellatospora tritici TaxID=2851566 RepID=UPI001C2D4D99|nr:ROK family transcriptional regulator [Catellatospora tritici]MBV1856027.1 ROK family protein [Catellatospora tritici]
MPPAGAAHTLVRRSHEERVLRVLQQAGALSRGEIAERVGLSRTTVSDITSELLERGAITVVDTDAAGRTGSGRPAELLALDPGSGQFMGVDFGHRRVHVAVADAAHEVIAAGTAHYLPEAPWSARCDAAFGLVDRLSTETGVHYGALQAIAVGVPGWGNRLSADGVADTFVARFHAPVTVDNHVRYAGLAEAARTAADTAQNLIYLRLSDGVGGGLVVDGRLVRGAGGHAGEFGHVTVAGEAGVLCRCGKRGCVETVASVPAILARCRELGVPLDDLDDLRAAVAIAQPTVDRVLRDAGTAVGRVLGAAAMTLNPSAIVLGGEIVTIAPTLLQQVRSTITYELSWLPDAAPVVRASALADSGGALGAITALFHESPMLADYPAHAAPHRSRSPHVHPTSNDGARWPS